MTRPTVLDMDLVVVPRDTGDTFSNSSLPSGMVEAGSDILEKCDDDLMHGTGPDWDYGMEAVATFRSMLSASPYPTAWDDVRKYVEGLENNWTDDDRARAWRESFDSMHQRAMSAEARIAELEKRLADAGRVISKQRDALPPLSDAVFNDNGDITVNLSMPTGEEFIAAYFADRVARAYMEGK